MIKTSVIVLSLVGSISLLLPSLAFAQSTYAYGLYGLFPQGSTRVLAMGGAATATSDDASGVAFNPAGLGLARWQVDLSSGTNRILNKEVDLTGDEQRDGIPYNFDFATAALKVKSVAIGGGMGSPYDMTFEYDSYYGTGEESIQLSTNDLAIAYKFSNSFAVGITAHQETARIIYRYDVTGIDIEDEVEAYYPTIGIMAKPKSGVGFGLTYSPERSYDMDESHNASVGPGSTWYRDIVIPAKFSAGVAIRKSSKLLIAFDVDVFMPVKNAIFVGGNETYFPDTVIKEKQQTVIHGGYEYKIIKQKDLDFTWRGGGYTEPPRLEEGDTRFHFTMGVEVRFGIVSVSAAYDQAEDFSSTAQSISINFGAL